MLYVPLPHHTLAVWPYVRICNVQRRPETSYDEYAVQVVKDNRNGPTKAHPKPAYLRIISVIYIYKTDLISGLFIALKCESAVASAFTQHRSDTIHETKCC